MVKNRHRNEAGESDEFYNWRSTRVLNIPKDIYRDLSYLNNLELLVGSEGTKLSNDTKLLIKEKLKQWRTGWVD